MSGFARDQSNVIILCVFVIAKKMKSVFKILLIARKAFKQYDSKKIKKIIRRPATEKIRNTDEQKKKISFTCDKKNIMKNNSKKK